MKKVLAIAAAAGALALAAPASAQTWQGQGRGGQQISVERNWQPINQRQRNLDARIDGGVRSGDLTRREAVQLRAEFNQIARLEARYRRGGLTYAERADLDRRFDALSQRIRFERNDWQQRGGGHSDRESINQRQREINARIDAGQRRGALSYREAYALRAEFSAIAQREAQYMRGGMSRAEARDIHQRLDALERRLFAERRDRDNRRG